MDTTILSANDPATIDRAVELLARGEPVALPTETVYGLAADATQPDAVLRIFEAKERPFFDPLIVHLPEIGWLDRVAQPQEGLVASLVAKYWPGPFTIVLPRRQIVPDIVTAGLSSVALRMSAHPVFHAIIEKFGKPVAAPSANRFGRISPTSAAHVSAELDGRIPLIIDAGSTTHGIESTIVRIDGHQIEILRSGPVTAEELAEFGEVRFSTREAGSPDAPGQLASHYAPRTPLRILDFGFRISDWQEKRLGLLAWNGPGDSGLYQQVERLSATHDLREAAATLFSKMRKLDEAELDLILVEAVPEEGLGIAIMDRLRKAAGREG